MQNRRIKYLIKEDIRIREINFGVLEGVVCMNDAREYLDPQMKKFFTDPWNFDRPKDGESIRDVLARTKEFWEELIHNPKLQDKTILIASHGCAVRALLHNVYKDHEDFWHGFVPPNCSVNVVEVTDGQAVSSGRLIKYMHKKQMTGSSFTRSCLFCVYEFFVKGG